MKLTFQRRIFREQNKIHSLEKADQVMFTLSIIVRHFMDILSWFDDLFGFILLHVCFCDSNMVVLLLQSVIYLKTWCDYFFRIILFAPVFFGGEGRGYPGVLNFPAIESSGYSSHNIS